MGAIRTSSASSFRDYAVASLPSSGEHDPVKSEIRDTFGVVEDTVDALGETVDLLAAANQAGTVIFENVASMLLGYDAATKAEVYADPTPAYNGVYRKVGASGAGSWVRDSDIGYVAQGLTVQKIARLREKAWLDGGVLSGDLSVGTGWTTAKFTLARAISAVRIEGAATGEQYFIGIFSNNTTGADAIAIYSSSGTPAIQAYFSAQIDKSTTGVTEVLVPEYAYATVPGLTVRLWIDYRVLSGTTGSISNSATAGPLWLSTASEADRTERRIAALETAAWTPFVDDNGDLAVMSANTESDPAAVPVVVSGVDGSVISIQQDGAIVRWIDMVSATPRLRRFDTEGLRNLPATVTKIVFVPLLGQSLATGTGGYPIITGAPTVAGRSWMFNGGSRVIQGVTWDNLGIRRIDDTQMLYLQELRESLPSDLINYGETQGGGISWWMGQSGNMASDEVLLFATFAFGGTRISELAAAVPYGNVILGVERIKALCDLYGLDLEVPGLLWDQGEADSDTGTTPTAYKASMTSLQAAFTTDVNAIVGGSSQLPMIIRQPSSFTKFGEAIDPLIFCVVDHAVANPTKFKLCGPQYHNPGYGVDGVHMGAGGYRLEGEYFGRALELIRAGSATNGLICTGVSNSGTTITAVFNAATQLVLDTTLVTDPGQYGLVLLAPDGTTTIGLSSISVSGSTDLTMTAASALTPGQTYTLAIADRGTANNSAGPTTGARSCIRDTSTDSTSAAVQAVLATALKLYNWAHHQRKTFVAA